MRGVGKLALLLALFALLGAGLSACGSDDSGDSTASATAETATPPAAGGDESSGGDAGAADKGSPSVPSSSAGSKGEGSAAFRTRGGDNSIQNYGEEADGSELDAAEAALSGYFDARATGDYAKQCAYLAKAILKPLEQLAADSSQLKGQDCAAILKELTGRVSEASLATPLVGGIASLRLEGGRGFALFHGPNGVDYFMPMAEKNGKWVVGALTASEFP